MTESDDNASADSGPLRTCAVTRERKPVDDLIRFVLSPVGEVVPDLAGRLPGRGLWVTAERHHIEQAEARKAFSRGFKRQVHVADGMAARIEQQLERRLSEAVSLATKAGQIISGFTKVDALIASGQAVALLHGCDAAADGRMKLDRKLAAVCSATGAEPAVIDELSIEQLSLAMGRENVVHAGLKVGGAARRIVIEAERLRRYRSGRRAF